MEKNDVCVKSWLKDMLKHDCECKELLFQDDLFANTPTVGYKCTGCGMEFSIHLSVIKNSSVKILLNEYFKTERGRYELTDFRARTPTSFSRWMNCEIL